MIKIFYSIDISKILILIICFQYLKKIIIPHVRMTGVIGSVGRFKQGIDLANQQEILKKHFLIKKQKL